MKIKSFLLVLLLVTAATSIAQKNLKFTPERPQAGDAITISYTPANELMGRKGTVEGLIFMVSANESNINDLSLKRSGDQYTATVQTDTADNFVYFSFSANGKYDNANNIGFWIKLYDGEQVKKGAYLSLSNYYSKGSEADKLKAYEAIQEEFKLYPEMKRENLGAYAYLVSMIKKEESRSIIQNEIENFLKKPLKTEKDYSTLAYSYAMAKLPAQSHLIQNIIWEKFPNGEMVSNFVWMQYVGEKNLERKEFMLDSILANIKNNDNAEAMEKSKTRTISQLADSYVEKADVEGMQAVIKKYNITGEYLASLYNSIAWKLQQNNEQMELAENFSEKATSWAKNEWENPTEGKPSFQSVKQWNWLRGSKYSSYADTYALILYKLGNYKKGFPYAEEAALKIGKGEISDQNGTYALLASKVLPPKKYVPQLEKFVEDRKANATVKEILKAEYLKKNSTGGFEAYLTYLEKRKYLKKMEEVKKRMLNIPAPQFTLMDLEGKEVRLEDYKDKVVVIDFWATWCAPCLASFPNMQKIVTKYKDDREVHFLFIDTDEHPQNMKKNAADLMVRNKYTFHVLLDKDKVAGDLFKLHELPTKFVIDKKGIIRFKPESDSFDDMMEDLTVMIDLLKTSM